MTEWQPEPRSLLLSSVSANDQLVLRQKIELSMFPDKLLTIPDAARADVLMRFLLPSVAPEREYGIAIDAVPLT